MTPQSHVSDEPDHTPGLGLSLFGFLNILLRRWRLVAAAGALGSGIAAAIAVTRPDLYEATSEFTLPPGQLSGSMAQQVGLQLYASLAQSPELLWQLSKGTYTFAPRRGEDTVSGFLPDLLGVPMTPDPDARTRRAARILDDRISASTNISTGTISVAVAAPTPGLAVALNERLLHELNQFNLEIGQKYASEERRFIGNRLDSTRIELAAAEEDLRAFLESNRGYAQSPALQIQHGRLERAVNLKGKLYMDLAQSLEQARIREVRTVPVISVVSDPAFNVGGKAGHTRLIALGLLVGLFFGVAAAFALEIISSQRRRAPEDYSEFRRLVGRPLGLLRHAPSPLNAPARPEASAEDRTVAGRH